MKRLYDQLLKVVDTPWMLANIERLWKAELGQSFRCYHESARLTERILKDSGFTRVERIPFPADGKATYLDATTPIAWDVTIGRLTVLRSPGYFAEPVVADYHRHPFHLIKGSTAVARGGVKTRLVTERQMYGGADVRGAMILGEPETLPRRALLKPAIEMGAIGVVTDYLPARYLTPDALHWVNSGTFWNNWHVQADDPPFVGFVVSPRVGDQLRAACNAGDVTVNVECDGRRYEGTIDVVTGVIPGKEKKELWIIAHLYEPLPDDNSAGVVCGIEIARAINKLVAAGQLPQPRFTLRVVFAGEYYGFCSYAEHVGGNLKGRVLGAMSIDGLPMTGHYHPASMITAAPGSPFMGDYLWEQLYESVGPASGLSITEFREGGYGDDSSLNDSMIGLSTIWMTSHMPLWHNSAQKMDQFDAGELRKSTAFSAAWIARMLTLDGDAAKQAIAQAGLYARRRLAREAGRLLADFAKADPKAQAAMVDQAKQAMEYRLGREVGRIEDFGNVCRGKAIARETALVRQGKERITRELLAKMKAMASKGLPAKPAPRALTSWEKIADAMVCARGTRGFPHDLNRIPASERPEVPDGGIYGAFPYVVSHIDGRRTLLDIFDEAQWETRQRFSPGTMKNYVNSIRTLAQYGYLKLRWRWTLGCADFVKALRRAGVKRGDLLMVHSSLSAFGQVDGGAATIVDALIEAVGPDGTLMMPTFTRSVVYKCGRPLTDRPFRPFDPAGKQAWTSAVAGEFAGRKGVLRSLHPTHSVAAFGPLAARCLSGHGAADVPVGRSSPFGKLADLGGKIVFLGASLASNTFLHLIETEAGAPYIGDAVCMVANADGSTRPVVIPRFPAGDREFYHEPIEGSKIYRTLIATGLDIRRSPLGASEIKVIDAGRMFELGTCAIKKDPAIMLCDDKNCMFCSAHKD
ncbi:MAG: AAC(3) family N-acetyltransferase [Phycisphaerae bacterium]